MGKMNIPVNTLPVKVDADGLNEVIALCEPLVLYMRENFNPYTKIEITVDGIKIKSDIVHIPLKTKTTNLERW